MLVLTRSLTQAQYGIELQSVMNATIAALVVTKVVLLADIVVVYIERLWESRDEYGTVAATSEHTIESLVWSHFWLEQLWMAVLFRLYCTLRELARALGGKTNARTVPGAPVASRQPRSVK